MAKNLQVAVRQRRWPVVVRCCLNYVTVTDLNLNVYSESKNSMENFQGIGE